METAQPEKQQGVTWDLTSFFPEFNGKEMLEFKQQLVEDLATLQETAAKLPPLSAESAADWEQLMLQTEDIEARLSHIFAYIGCLKAAHTDKPEYAQEEGKLMKLLAEYEKLGVDIMQAFKVVPDEVFDAFIAREALAEVAHPLRRVREKAQHTMSPEEEKLAADLNVDGLRAWGRLYDTVSGKLQFEMVYPDGHKEMKPISQWRSLMSDADREIGKAAYEGGNRAWESIEDVCAAALNAIAGTRLTLYKHRGIDDYLYTALFQASIKRESLDAMYAAIHDNIEIARDIFRAKARAMGRDGIYWFEREAPLPLAGSARYSWEEGTRMVTRAFETAYPALADYYRSFLEKRWLESEVRPAKLPGAFCTGSPVNKEQRVYMTFNGTLSDVTTMAHEVGHAWHGHLLKDMRPMAQEYPMTLAETASIFGEHILADGIYEDDSISDREKLLMLDKELCGDAVMLLDITVRFEFEKAFHEERMKGEVSVARLKELMQQKQREVFGDSLIPESADPMFWASKLHFYIAGVTFYNFPYTFGFLLAHALYHMFKREGASFLPKYEEFLRLTGSDTAENVVARTVGGDTTDPAFWAESIKSLAEPLARYNNLLAK